MKTLSDLINDAHTEIPKVKYSDLVENKDVYILIDVREPDEIEKTGSIDGALKIPRGLIEMKLNHQNLDINTPIVVFCGGGSRAALSGLTLKKIGYKNVRNLEGGFREYLANKI